MNYTDLRKKVIADKEFAEKFADCKTPADVVKVAVAEGYDITEDDIKNNTELLPEELELTAGGKTIAAAYYFVTDSGTGHIITER